MSRIKLGQLFQQFEVGVLLCLLFRAAFLRCGAAAIAAATTVGGLLADAYFVLLVKADGLDFECGLHERSVHVVQVDIKCNAVAKDRQALCTDSPLVPRMVRDVTRIIREFDVDHVVVNARAFDITHRRCFGDFKAARFQGSAKCGARLLLHALKVEADDE
eukprot:6197496-Pleurochrysis_carterae.AAC.2